MSTGAGLAPAPFGGRGFAQLLTPGQAAQAAREREARRLWPGSPEWAEHHELRSKPEPSFAEVITGEDIDWEDIDWEDDSEWEFYAEEEPHVLGHFLGRLAVLLVVSILVALVAGAFFAVGLAWASPGEVEPPGWLAEILQ